MKDSKEFMLLFRFQPDFNNQPTQEELDAMNQQWGSFFGKLAIQEKLVSTHRLGFEGMLIATDKKTSDGINMDGGNTLGGYVIVKAHSMEEAVEIGKESPILLMGGNVEVRSTIPM